LQIHDFNATGSYNLLFDFNVGIFNERQRQMLIEQYLRVFDAFLDNPDQHINQVGLASPEEQQKLVIDYNQSTAPFPADQTVVQLIESQVECTPQSPAVVFESNELTYMELNQRANQLAHKLRRLGAGPEQFVGICMDHSLEMVVALLGILKSGAAYVPLDPTYPKDRLAYMLADIRQGKGMTRPLLVTQPWLLEKLPEGEHSVVNLDDTWSVIDNEDSSNPPQPAGPQNLAYVIYTSGSTGLPKGVLIEHRSLVNYLWWARESYFQGELLDFALFSSLSFDLTVTSIYVPLISGSRIVVYREDPGARGMVIRKVIEDNRADIVKLTPAHLSMILDLDLPKSKVQKFIVGGFDFKTNLALRVDLAYNSQIEIFNEYGPTETVVGCMLHRFDRHRDQASSVPIGVPAANVQIYILDKYLNPVPSEVTGEIYVGGVGVGRGYLNQAELSEQKFVPNPFRPGERMYRTGDLARWQPNGQMLFLGRADDQVKIGGARIELGEIESRLADHPRIKESVVTVIQSKIQATESELRFCVGCGLPSNYPGVHFDDEGICSQCHSYERIKDRAQTYFKSMDDLHKLFEEGKSRKKGDYDCLALVSGGKDSSYMLSQLAGMGLKVLSFTLDNGYISEQAKENIKKVSAYLGVDHLFGTTPAMNAIFVESLQQYSNVCNGCFKTLYTLAVNVAREKGIPFIVTGLSRGQFFETRLTEDLFQDGALDNESIDQAILEARKVYHRRQDLISRELDVDAFRDDAIFDDIQFVDFYRYTDISLDEVYTYLNKHVPWIRPADTGRSTNCLINDLGIYLHTQQRGFHNYALPYSWDVRMGHKKREDAIDELHDEIDEAAVKQMMQEIGYDEPDLNDDPSTKRLAAYYVSDGLMNASELRTYLSQHLPDFMLPSYLIHLDALPLTRNGKIDLDALPDPQSERPDLDSTYIAPRNSLEERLVRVWEETLGLIGIGVQDNFFELGGDSITSLQIVARTNKLGLHLKPNHLFQHPTIAKLTTIASSTSIIAPQTNISGPVPLTPIQFWFLEQRFAGADHWNQTLQIDVMQPVDAPELETSLNKLIEHHDQLRATFPETEDGWQQFVPSSAQALRLQHFDIANLKPSEQGAALEQIAASTQTHLDLARGPLVHAALVARGSGQPARLILAVHHLVVDALSWWVLLDDLQTAYTQLRDKKPVTLPLKTTPYLHWSKILHERAKSLTELEYWQDIMQTPAVNLPFDTANTEGDLLEKNTRTLESWLDADQTAGLLHRIPVTYETQIDEVLLAALASTLTDWLGIQVLRIDLERHGREEINDEIDLTRTVGWFTTIHPVILSDAGPDPGSALRKMKTNLETVPNKGIGFGMLRYLHENPTVRDSLSGPTAPILFNHLGQYNTLLAGSADLQLAEDLQVSRSPTAKRPYILEINSIIRDGRLRVDWTYSEHAFSTSTIEKLAHSYIQHLDQFVQSSTQAVQPTSTPTGVTESGLDDAELDALLAEFSESAEETTS
jgi:amino acid adenylation domain-containing protein/non-ribosomal peptide synthase protein (TIGR01720 family)